MIDEDYFFEPEVFHQLHCLNEIRMHIDRDYYESNGHDHHNLSRLSPGLDRIHIDHCLEQIRSSLMCAGDLSPVPMYTWKGFPLAFGRSGTHTCRKWEPIRAWYDERIERYGAVQSDGTKVDPAVGG